MTIATSGSSAGLFGSQTIDNWSQWVVLAAIIVTVIGFMIASSPPPTIEALVILTES